MQWGKKIIGFRSIMSLHWCKVRGLNKRLSYFWSNIDMKSKKPFLGGWQPYVLFLYLSLVLSACTVSVGNSPRCLQGSVEVEKLFQSATILPDHTYYVQGPASDPEAIMALKNTYQLRSGLWSRVEWTEKEMARVVFWMENDEIGFCTTDGGNLVAPDGQIIGIWYSQRDTSMIKQPEPGVIEVYPFHFTPGSPCHRQFMQDAL